MRSGFSGGRLGSIILLPVVLATTCCDLGLSPCVMLFLRSLRTKYRREWVTERPVVAGFGRLRLQLAGDRLSPKARDLVGLDRSRGGRWRKGTVQVGGALPVLVRGQVRLDVSWHRAPCLLMGGNRRHEGVGSPQTSLRRVVFVLFEVHRASLRLGYADPLLNGLQLAQKRRMKPEPS